MYSVYVKHSIALFEDHAQFFTLKMSNWLEKNLFYTLLPSYYLCIIVGSNFYLLFDFDN